MTTEYRFAVNVTPKAGILDPQGRAVEGSLGHLGIEGVSGVRVGRRVELTVVAPDEAGATATVERLAAEPEVAEAAFNGSPLRIEDARLGGHVHGVSKLGLRRCSLPHAITSSSR